MALRMRALGAPWLTVVEQQSTIGAGASLSLPFAFTNIGRLANSAGSAFGFGPLRNLPFRVGTYTALVTVASSDLDDPIKPLPIVFTIEGNENNHAPVVSDVAMTVHEDTTTNLPPVARMTSPTFDTYADLGETMALQISAHDIDNAITNVRLLVDGVYVDDATHVTNTFYTVPYTTPTEVGSNALQVIAYDEDELASTARTVVVHAAPLRDGENPLDTIQGLSYAYYEGEWERLPDFTALIPESTGFVQSLTFDPAQRKDHFGMVYSGYLNISRRGVYTFFLDSDEGSQLFIGDALVVDNDGIHTNQQAAGEIGLDAGLHAFHVAYFERTGAEALTFVEGPEGGVPVDIQRTRCTRPGDDACRPRLVHVLVSRLQGDRCAHAHRPLCGQACGL